MGLQLILGSSGTGKTTKIYNDMLQKSSIDKDRKYVENTIFRIGKKYKEMEKWGNIYVWLFERNS